MRWVRLLVVLVVLGLVPVAAAGAQPQPQPPAPPYLTADTERPGQVDLYLFDVPGTRVRFYERVHRRLVALGEATVAEGTTAVRILGATTWRCDRRTRSFRALAEHPDGTVAPASFAVRTPSCRDRLRLVAPRRAPPGSLVGVTVRDTWRLGDVNPSLCAITPRGGRLCRRVRFGGRPLARRRVRLTRDGRWRLELRLGRARVRRTLLSGLPGGRRARSLPRVLVTGDSTVQGIGAFLADRLGRTIRVAEGWRGGSAISDATDRWPARAARQARRLRPRVTVMSVGANEGWPLGGAECCGEAWQAAYSERVRGIVGSYARQGRGHVLWLTLPTPADPRRQVITDAVNAAVARAAAGDPRVTIVALDQVISPGGRFTRTLRYRGRTRVVRAPDGVHLSVAGTAIAADLLVRVLGEMPQLLTPGR